MNNMQDVNRLGTSPSTMIKIFISYRRADSLKDAGRIYDRLIQVFGKDQVFKDVDNIPVGKDFRGVLREAVAQCDVQLAIIGKMWLTITDEQGQRRLDNPGDFVRIEIESALQRDSCTVIPVLVDNAKMPAADALPLELRELAFKNAAIVRDDPDFHSDVTRLIEGIQPSKGSAPRKPADSGFSVSEAIADFFEAMDERQWDDARALLAEIRASGKAPRTFNVDAHEADLWAEIQAGKRDQEYMMLQMMAGMQRPNPQRIWEGLQVFWLTYPGHDPDHLARFKPGSRSAALLPAPFAWVSIPAGKVTLKGEDESYIPEGKSQTFDVPAFSISKYPLTNAQYKLFVDAGGYTQQQWWTAAGWEARAEGLEWVSQMEEFQPTGKAWTEPRRWNDIRLNGADQPVVGVSWYEAVAFCAWVSEASGERVSLPTEQQWQRAAQGDDGRAFPWGKKWDGGRCNNNVDSKGVGQTTPVRTYEGKVDSPFGVVDMAGNVWEWCLTAYGTGSTDLDGIGVRVLRGGSWDDGLSDKFRCDDRYRNFPRVRLGSWGIRLALS
jgi:formylglycine-generating enzyme required for sulfatase activity